MKRLAALALVLSFTPGCTCSSTAETVASGSAPAASDALAASATTDASALTHHRTKTTEPEIALKNLRSQLDGQIRQMERRPKDLQARSGVVTVSLARFKLLGKSEDLERAIELGEGATKIEEKSFAALLLRARGRAAAHRFEEALADLDAADKVAEPHDKGKTAGVRANILIALGRYEEALPTIEKEARVRPTSEALADHAYLLGLMGRTAEAESLFVQAEQKHRGTSPFGLVQIYFDRGSMWEKQGNLSEATTLYKAAHAKLPQHPHVAVHLASLVPPAEGVAILEPVAKETDDPDVFAELGTLQNLVTPGSGDAMIKKAGAAYDELFAKLPSGYADHAGWFWVTTGGDPKKGLTAAQKNIGVRQTADAYELLIAAAEAAKDTPVLCTALKGAKTLKYSSPPLKERVRQLDGKVACGN
jgi:tetratricopeptide (TPR) repeat protein